MLTRCANRSQVGCCMHACRNTCVTHFTSLSSHSFSATPRYSCWPAPSKPLTYFTAFPRPHTPISAFKRCKEAIDAGLAAFQQKDFDVSLRCCVFVLVWCFVA